ncbi:Fic family protein (plasmid) [Adhaeribacter swui]|uniref:Fic family protein n=1 Tax=Adhaeribacter swui TaxID=2086471 RepID=A0A7G7G238_9BACT|nr:Fic family protein [Adhaeribacter swui]QNF31222.1 Fic family protein [Adhaeribacter swui]
MINNYFSEDSKVFYDRVLPEEGYLVGYGALIASYKLKVPLPDRLALVIQKHKKYETEEWSVFSIRYKPEDTFFGQLTFAFKYEGIELGVLKALFQRVAEKEIVSIIQNEPTSQYSRRIWFLYEWLLDTELDVPDLTQGNFVDLIDPHLQYPGPIEISRRHRIRNNLPGVKNFCPLIRRTAKLEDFIAKNLNGKVKDSIGRTHADILTRAAAFLLLKDSKASYAIEGERPPQNRAQRWARSIGQAGQKPLSQEEFLRLQQIVIDNPRFVKLGWRTEGGFVGEHDRFSGLPIPDHISAKWQDVEELIAGLIFTNIKLEHSEYDAVLAAAAIAFGFVFIHPFVDGNGRIHRYLIHHSLIRKNFAPKGFIFPVSAVILERLDEYRQVLEAFSLPRLEFIQWQPTTNHNVEVLNETIDLYRYFDATKQAEFLYRCVEQTVEKTIPEEVDYLEKYDRMKSFLEDYYEMPDRLIALLVRFLEQGKGSLSERAKTKEFSKLTSDEVLAIENRYQEIFNLQ